jgi:succinyl-diaminopimelate desuccinylase
MKNGRRGSLSAKLTVRGVQGHVAYPEQVKNPVHLAAPALAELAATPGTKATSTSRRPASRFPTPTPAPAPATSCRAASSSTSISASPPPARSTACKPRASTARPPRPRIRHRLDPRRQALPDAARRTLRGAHRRRRRHQWRRRELSTTGGTSDGRFIADICPQLVEFGPVNASIHKIDECIAVADLEPLARIYELTSRNC